MNELDQLDRLLFDAFDDRRRRTDAPGGDVAAIRPAYLHLQRRRRRRQAGLATVFVAGAVAAAGVVVNGSDEGNDPSIYASDATMPSSPPSTAGGSAVVPMPTATPIPADVPLWGWLPDPGDELSVWSAARVDGPGRVPDAQVVIELGTTDDWRDGPRAAVVIADRPAIDVIATGSTPLDIAGRRGWYRPEPDGTTRVAVDLEGGRSLRITAADLDLDALGQVVAATEVEGDEVSFDGLPSDLHPTSSAIVDRATYQQAYLTYAVDRPASGTIGLRDQVFVRATDDPVAVAEETVAGSFAEPTSDAEVGGLPAVRTTGGSMAWRAGAGWYVLEARPAGFETTPEELSSSAVARLHEMTDVEATTIAVSRMSVTAWPTDQWSQLTYPVDTAAQGKVDAFLAALPAGFAEFTADPPPDIATDGIRVRTYNDQSDEWIELHLAPSVTGGGPTGTAPVVQDLGWARTVVWHAPSGWTYVLRASSKSSDRAPLTVAQATSLLESLDG